MGGLRSVPRELRRTPPKLYGIRTGGTRHSRGRIDWEVGATRDSCAASLAPFTLHIAESGRSRTERRRLFWNPRGVEANPYVAPGRLRSFRLAKVDDRCRSGRRSSLRESAIFRIAVMFTKSPWRAIDRVPTGWNGFVVHVLAAWPSTSSWSWVNESGQRAGLRAEAACSLAALHRVFDVQSPPQYELEAVSRGSFKT